jgi:hypothetical protein
MRQVSMNYHYYKEGINSFPNGTNTVTTAFYTRWKILKRQVIQLINKKQLMILLVIFFKGNYIKPSLHYYKYIF